MDVLITVLIGGASGVLIGTAGAKLWAIAGMRLAWPQGANFLSLHLSSGFVIAVEILAAAAALALPSARLACLILAGVYAAFVIGAITLRGQECGCFGVSGNEGRQAAYLRLRARRSGTDLSRCARRRSRLARARAPGYCGDLSTGHHAAHRSLEQAQQAGIGTQRGVRPTPGGAFPDLYRLFRA